MELLQRSDGIEPENEENRNRRLTGFRDSGVIQSCALDQSLRAMLQFDEKLAVRLFLQTPEGLDHFGTPIPDFPAMQSSHARQH